MPLQLVFLKSGPNGGKIDGAKFPLTVDKDYKIGTDFHSDIRIQRQGVSSHHVTLSVSQKTSKIKVHCISDHGVEVRGKKLCAGDEAELFAEDCMDIAGRSILLKQFHSKLPETGNRESNSLKRKSKMPTPVKYSKHLNKSLLPASASKLPVSKLTPGRKAGSCSSHRSASPYHANCVHNSPKPVPHNKSFIRSTPTSKPITPISNQKRVTPFKPITTPQKSALPTPEVDINMSGVDLFPHDDIEDETIPDDYAHLPSESPRRSPLVESPPRQATKSDAFTNLVQNMVEEVLLQQSVISPSSCPRKPLSPKSPHKIDFSPEPEHCGVVQTVEIGSPVPEEDQGQQSPVASQRSSRPQLWSSARSKRSASDQSVSIAELNLSQTSSSKSPRRSSSYTPSKTESPKISKTSPQVSPKSTPKTSPKSTPKTSPKSTPKTSPKSTPKMSPKSTPKTSPKSTPKMSPKSTQKISPKTTPKISPKTTPKISPKTTPKISPKTTPKITKISPRSSSKQSPKSSSNISPKGTGNGASRGCEQAYTPGQPPFGVDDDLIDLTLELGSPDATFESVVNSPTSPLLNPRRSKRVTPKSQTCKVRSFRVTPRNTRKTGVALAQTERLGVLAVKSAMRRRLSSPSRRRISLMNSSKKVVFSPAVQVTPIPKIGRSSWKEFAEMEKTIPRAIEFDDPNLDQTAGEATPSISSSKGSKSTKKGRKSKNTPKSAEKSRKSCTKSPKALVKGCKVGEESSPPSLAFSSLDTSIVDVTSTPKSEASTRKKGRKTWSSSEDSSFFTPTSMPSLTPRVTPRTAPRARSRAAVLTPNTPASPVTPIVEMEIERIMDQIEQGELQHRRERGETSDLESPASEQLLTTPRPKRNVDGSPKLKMKIDVNQLVKLANMDKMKTPSFVGVRKMLATPKGQADTPQLNGIKELLAEVNTPKRKSAKKVSSKIASMQEMPSPSLEGIKELVKTPIQKKTSRTETYGQTPKCGTSGTFEGVEELLQSPKKVHHHVEEKEGVENMTQSPGMIEGASPNLIGVRHMMRTPTVVPSPEYSGIEHLFQPEDQSTPIVAKRRSVRKSARQSFHRRMPNSSSPAIRRNTRKVPAFSLIQCDVEASAQKRGGRKEKEGGRKGKEGDVVGLGNESITKEGGGDKSSTRVCRSTRKVAVSKIDLSLETCAPRRARQANVSGVSPASGKVAGTSKQSARKPRASKQTKIDEAQDLTEPVEQIELASPPKRAKRGLKKDAPLPKSTKRGVKKDAPLPKSTKKPRKVEVSTERTGGKVVQDEDTIQKGKPPRKPRVAKASKTDGSLPEAKNKPVKKATEKVAKMNEKVTKKVEKLEKVTKKVEKLEKVTKKVEKLEEDVEVIPKKRGRGRAAKVVAEDVKKGARKQKSPDSKSEVVITRRTTRATVKK